MNGVDQSLMSNEFISNENNGSEFEQTPSELYRSNEMSTDNNGELNDVSLPLQTPLDQQDIYSQMSMFQQQQHQQQQQQQQQQQTDSREQMMRQFAQQQQQQRGDVFNAMSSSSSHESQLHAQGESEAVPNNGDQESYSSEAHRVAAFNQALLYQQQQAHHQHHQQQYLVAQQQYVLASAALQHATSNNASIEEQQRAQQAMLAAALAQQTILQRHSAQQAIFKEAREREQSRAAAGLEPSRHDSETLAHMLASAGNTEPATQDVASIGQNELNETQPLATSSTPATGDVGSSEGLPSIQGMNPNGGLEGGTEILVNNNQLEATNESGVEVSRLTNQEASSVEQQLLQGGGNELHDMTTSSQPPPHQAHQAQQAQQGVQQGGGSGVGDGVAVMSGVGELQSLDSAGLGAHQGMASQQGMTSQMASEYLNKEGMQNMTPQQQANLMQILLQQHNYRSLLAQQSQQAQAQQSQQQAQQAQSQIAQAQLHAQQHVNAQAQLAQQMSLQVNAQQAQQAQGMNQLQHMAGTQGQMGGLSMLQLQQLQQLQHLQQLQQAQQVTGESFADEEKRKAAAIGTDLQMSQIHALATHHAHAAAMGAARRGGSKEEQTRDAHAAFQAVMQAQSHLQVGGAASRDEGRKRPRILDDQPFGPPRADGKRSKVASAPVRPSNWTEEQDRLLCEVVGEYGAREWKKISQRMGDHGCYFTDVQCLHRWNKVLKPGLKKGPWTEEEDQIVTELVHVHGVGKIKWSQVAEKLPGRIGKQCRERWFNHLDKQINKTDWDHDENSKLYELQVQHGNKWSTIAKLMSGRTENGVKNRFNSSAYKKWATEMKLVLNGTCIRRKRKDVINVLSQQQQQQQLQQQLQQQDQLQQLQQQHGQQQLQQQQLQPHEPPIMPMQPVLTEIQEPPQPPASHPVTVPPSSQLEPSPPTGSSPHILGVPVTDAIASQSVSDQITEEGKVTPPLNDIPILSVQPPLPQSPAPTTSTTTPAVTEFQGSLPSQQTITHSSNLPTTTATTETREENKQENTSQINQSESNNEVRQNDPRGETGELQGDTQQSQVPSSSDKPPPPANSEVPIPDSQSSLLNYNDSSS